MKTAMLNVILALALAVLPSSVAVTAAARIASAGTVPSTVVNGGLEVWENGGGKAGGPRPAGWGVACEPVPGVQPGGRVERDAQCRHSGRFALRISNRNNGSLTYVRIARPIPVQPNRRYILRWWVCGKDVGQGGAGAIMMGYYLTRNGEREQRINFAQPGEDRPRGTFDWQPKQFAFVTRPGATTAVFTFQLRYTVGTVWYDDIELVPREAVTPVDTY